MSNENDVNIEVNEDEKSNEDANKDANEDEKYVQFALFYQFLCVYNFQTAARHFWDCQSDIGQQLLAPVD